MPEPSDFQKALVEEATYLRGLIIRSYSQIEFLLADISVKLDLRFPYLISKRISAVRQISERDGYGAYKNDLNKVCDDLLYYDELRNFMAHGFMMLTTDKKDSHRFEFRMYQRKSKEEFELHQIHVTLPLLEKASQEITNYVADAVRLFARIYLEKRIEQPKDGALLEPKNNPSEQS